ncbi:probable serine/threonine-protein kinase PBL28 [Selaginella moellendorffii]|uniref:probable serine/threonine-protein kinase PBL28 n=1 Tax=Selaginella moellendorffii TaxID=88036 RepID=UPI000D1CEF18|nr:probable serine/threonine-protein kinase PBL28 [Selaginella moellendorffii]|eukprot:XP_002994217.2 probable serine/threonine-protein kinase PBL28 [Selaginella moellendorffii]
MPAAVFTIFKLWPRRRKKKETPVPDRKISWSSHRALDYWSSTFSTWDDELQFLQQLPPPPIVRLPPIVDTIFTLKEMLLATANFSSDNLLGEGGFGRVYRGVLKNGQIVAVKQMEPSLSKGVQGEREFRVEVDILSRLDHSHLVKLIGYCADKGQRMLVYEFMPHGNLQEHLHGIVRVKMDWRTRVSIARGAATALEYLHNGPATGNPVIHRDFKSSNILLDDKFQAKVSDFGLAKLVPYGNQTYVSTRVLGTFGYFDPQYTATGRLTLKSDVYAFGVVMLELLTGRRPVNATYTLRKQNLVTQVRDWLREKRKLKKILDPELRAELPWQWDSIRRFASLAFDCIRDDDTRRPTMSQCARELELLHLSLTLYSRSSRT